MNHTLTLREESERFLKNRELPVSGPDSNKRRFTGAWPVQQLRSEREAFCRERQEYTPDDVSLMLCYVTGNLPVLPDTQSEVSEAGEVLSGLLSYLRELPAASPLWQAEIPNFAASVSSIIDEKVAQLRWASDFDAVLRAINSEFGDLLGFFEWDTHAWSAVKVSPTADSSAALALAQSLRNLLNEYVPVHEMASGISEERERSSQRAALQASILEALQNIGALMTEEPGEDSSGEPASEAPEGRSDPISLPQSSSPVPEDGSTAVDENAAERDHPQTSSFHEEVRPAPTAVSDSPVPEAEPITASDYEALRSENSSLRDGSHALHSENRDLRDEVESLKAELFSSQKSEDSWRMALRSVKEGAAESVEAPEPEMSSVREAVETAMGRFRQELLFAPNSESSIEDNPFTDPARVWEALRWLANTYYASKMGRLRVTDFDQSIKEACGWWYKGDQGETTVSKFEKSYTTRVEGKRYTLVEHIGKGTTFDARYTIRIAFDWDREKRQVVIGYIGRHQQTDAS